jgi:hypothetical protein
MVRNFHGIQSWAPGVVSDCKVVGELEGDQVGAKRVLNDAFHETLQGLDDLAKTIQYTIDDGPGPVAKDAVRNYVGTVRMYPITANDTTFVEWISQYDSPNSSAVGELCNPIYHALLEDLASKFA